MARGALIDEAVVAALCEEGLSTRAIAERMDRSEGGVNKAIRRLGLGTHAERLKRLEAERLRALLGKPVPRSQPSASAFAWARPFGPIALHHHHQQEI